MSINISDSQIQSVPHNSDDIRTIEKPAEGETLSVMLGQNQLYELKFNVDDIQSVVKEGNNFVCSFDDNSKIIFENLPSEISQANGIIASPQEKFLDSLNIIEQLTLKLHAIEGQLLVEDVESYQVEYSTVEDQLAVQLANIEPSSAENLSIFENSCGPENVQGEDINPITTADILDNLEPASGNEGSNGASTQGGYGFSSSADSVPLELLSAIGPIIETALQYNAEFPRLNAVDQNAGVVETSSVIPEILLKTQAESIYIKEDGQGLVLVSASYSNGQGDEKMTLSVTGVNSSWTVTAPDWVYNNGVYTLELAPGQNSYNGSFTFKSPLNSDLDMTGLALTANVSNSNGVTKTSSQDFSIYVDAVVDAPVLTVPANLSQAWYYNKKSYATPLKIASSVSDIDGSEIITKIVIKLDNPFSKPVSPYFTLDDMGIGLNKGTEISSGVWEIQVVNGDAASALNGLMLVVPGNMNYHAIHQSITGAHIGNITVISYVSEANLSGLESDYTDNTATVVQNINLSFVITPLVLDLNGNGADLVSIEAGVMFDMNNNGTLDKTSWVNAQDGLLALDINKDGLINNQSELFGDSATARDGFANLGQYDSNHDGRINASDAVFKDLIVWRDVNQDGISQANEKSVLSDFNIVAINLQSTQINQALGDSIIMHESTFEYGDGKQGHILDVGFNVKEGSSLNEGAYIKGTDYNDIIHATSGNDEMYGGGGSDKFMFDAISKGVDVIRDFSLAEGDVLDFSSFFQNTDTTQQAINSFVFSREVDGGTIVSIDVKGTGDAANAVDIVALEGLHDFNVQDMVQSGNIHIM